MGTAAKRELARILHVHGVERISIQHVARGRPADGAHVSVGDGVAERLRDAHDEEQIAIRQSREAGIERAEHVGRYVERAAERRPAEVDVVGPKDETVGAMPLQWGKRASRSGSEIVAMLVMLSDTA